MSTRLIALILITILCGCDRSVSRLAPAELPARTGVAAASLPMDAESVDAAARELVVARNWPGLSLAVGQSGRLVWAHSIGFADLEKMQPLTPDTRIRIGAVTQAVTAAMIATLVNDGILDLDAPASRYLPDLPRPYAKLTTRELLQHAAGVRDHRGEDEFISGARHCADSEERLAIFVDDPLQSDPAPRPRHSAYGLVLAGAVAEAAGGAPYRELIERRILEPLGMTRTGIAPPAGGQVLGDPGGPGQPKSGGDAWLYWPFAATDTSYGLEQSSQSDLSCVVSAEGLVSTPSDLVSLGNALLAGNLVPTGQVDALLGAAPANADSADPGMGWQRHVIRVGDRRVATYTARANRGDRVLGPGVPGGTATLILVPDHELVIAAATNVTFARELDGFTRDLIARVIGK